MLYGIVCGFFTPTMPQEKRWIEYEIVYDCDVVHNNGI